MRSDRVSKRHLPLGRSQSGSAELLDIRRHRVVLVCFARLASAPYPIVLADTAPSAVLALAPSPIVLADARPSALLALAPLPIVLADARPSALLALAPYPSVLADARPSALLALAPYPSVLAERSCVVDVYLETKGSSCKKSQPMPTSRNRAR